MVARRRASVEDRRKARTIQVDMGGSQAGFGPAVDGDPYAGGESAAASFTPSPTHHHRPRADASRNGLPACPPARPRRPRRRHRLPNCRPMAATTSGWSPERIRSSSRACAGGPATRRRPVAGGRPIRPRPPRSRRRPPAPGWQSRRLSSHSARSIEGGIWHPRRRTNFGEPMTSRRPATVPEMRRHGLRNIANRQFIVRRFWLNHRSAPGRLVWAECRSRRRRPAAGYSRRRSRNQRNPPRGQRAGLVQQDQALPVEDLKHLASLTRMCRRAARPKAIVTASAWPIRARRGKSRSAAPRRCRSLWQG